MIKENRIVNMVYEDTKDFLLYDTDRWSKAKNSGSFVAYGLLNAVFETLFHLAPSKDAVIETILMSLSNFLEKEDWDKYKMTTKQ